jgi:TATA-box binding protein (TBP) (component of TFIID and TFIIIB)
VMINTNFSLNYSINPIKVLEHFSKHSIFVAEFKPDEYSAVKIKFKPAADMKTVTVSIFATGKVIITGAETLKEIAFAYNIINHHMASNSALKVGPTQDSGVFDIFMGYHFDDWVPTLKKLGAKPWIFDRENCKINF